MPPTDFERDLSELLHTVTPEPPEHLASPPIAALRQASRPDAEATVIDLVPGTSHATKRRHRWPAFAAAAAVAALAAGVVAVSQIGNTGHPTTHQSAANRQVPQCREQRQLVSIVGPRVVTHGHTGAYTFGFTNRWANRCALPPVSVKIGRGVTPAGIIPPAEAVFPASAQQVQIPGHGRVVYTAHFRVTGRCQTGKDGLFIYVDLPHTGGIMTLGVAGCTLTPLRLTHRVVG